MCFRRRGAEPVAPGILVGLLGGGGSSFCTPALAPTLAPAPDGRTSPTSLPRLLSLQWSPMGFIFFLATEEGVVVVDVKIFRFGGDLDFTLFPAELGGVVGAALAVPARLDPVLGGESGEGEVGSCLFEDCLPPAGGVVVAAAAAAAPPP